MSLLPILLLAVVMAVDEGLRPLGADWGIHAIGVLTIALAPVGFIVATCAVVVRRCERRLSRRQSDAGYGLPRRGVRPIIAADRVVRIGRWLIVANHAVAVLVFGWLGTVRWAIGDLILIDEVVAILPPLLGLIGTWWAHYPIDRRLREALLIRRLDEGRPVYAIPSRLGYVLLQSRLQLLLLLVPILVIVGMSEGVQRMIVAVAPPESAAWVGNLSTFVLAAGVFVISPLLARAVLDVAPMAPGPLRESLLEVCRRHNVRVRELLVWNTHGSMINAAVMGLFGALRYVLITDALLETLREEQVTAVMAHEVGHVRRHHMPWLVGCLMAAFVIAVGVIELPLRGIEATGWADSQLVVDWIVMASTVAQVIIGFTVFGWVCRRFERQADTFAVQHLSGMGAPQAIDEMGQNVAPPVVAVTPGAIDAMCGALGAIAQLNTIDPKQPSWRHGSIEWRIRYLWSIIGRPVSSLPIDRLIRWVKVATAIVLIGAFAYEVTAAWQSSNGAQQSSAAITTTRDLHARHRYDSSTSTVVGEYQTAR